MEDQQNKALAVFNQICEVNGLDPHTISEEAQKRFSDKMKTGKEVEMLIWTALDHRARALLKETGTDTRVELKGNGGEYSIDGDPAAPAFVINEDTIRSKHSKEIAEQIIEALGDVKLPVQA